MQESKQRDNSLDIAKAILIILMIIGHMQVSSTTRAIIYSFHMAGFVFYSGYCFKTLVCEDLKQYFKSLAKTFLLPYLLWTLFYLVMGERDIISKILDVLCGMSKTKLVFPEIATVGQVYFLLLLFLVRLIYAILYRYVKNDGILTGIIVLFSVIGMFLGQVGMWLPWSFDCTLFTIIFYHAGFLVKKYEILKFLSEHKKYYLFLIMLWFLSILQGGMSLYIRDYGNYIITVLGAISASILLYKASAHLTSYINHKLLKVMIMIGKNTLSILLVHTIFGGYIVIAVINGLMRTGIIESLNINYLLILLIHIILGLLWGKVYEKVCNAMF